MSPSMVVADCPECRGVRTVILGVCEVCFAEFGEHMEAETYPILAEDEPPIGSLA